MRALVRAYEAGRVVYSQVRKTPAQATVAGWWVDLSMASGNPPLNFYTTAPLAAAVLDPFRGIFHGDAKAPATKILKQLSLVTPSAGLVGKYRLLDYVLYYPTIDLDDASEQTFDNTVTLPRYTDGAGLRAMLVATVPTTGGGGTFTFNYINQDGVPKTSPVHTAPTASAGITSIITSERATAAGGRLFLTLDGGDTGIRSITSFTPITRIGGFAALVLVKPIAELELFEINTPASVSFPDLDPDLPVIEDGAFLGLVVNCAASVAATTLAGHASFLWSD